MIPLTTSIRLCTSPSTETTLATLPWTTFTRFSALRQYRPTIELHPQTPLSAARYVVDWILAQAEQEVISPLPPTATPNRKVKDDDEDERWISFEEASHRYNVCYQLHLHRAVRGEELRDEIWLYLWSSRETMTLTVQDLVILLDLMPFDTALVRLAVSGFVDGRGAGVIANAQNLLVVGWLRTR